jgi:hypothetical protein
MRALLLLTALGITPVAAATQAPPPAPVTAPPQTRQDVRKDDSKLLPPNMRYDSRRIQVRPGSGKPNSEKAGPGIG